MCPAADDSSHPGDDEGTQHRRVVYWLSRLAAARSMPPRARAIALAIAAALFIGLAIFSFRSLPERAHANWWAGAALLVSAPLIAVLNAAEYRVMGAVNDHRIGWRPAYRLAVLSSAANLLPIPGGVVIRTQALHRQGSTYGRALTANAAAGIAWIGAAALGSGALLLVSHHPVTPAALLLAGGIGCIAGVGLLLRGVNRDHAGGLLASLVAVEMAIVAFLALRLALAFAVIGLHVSAAQAVALTAAQIIAAAVGFLPGGLGLRELLAGGIGSAVNLRASTAIAASVVDRIFDQLGLSLLAAVVVVVSSRRRRMTEIPDVSQAE
jgi:hypothetical protein